MLYKLAYGGDNLNQLGFSVKRMFDEPKTIISHLQLNPIYDKEKEHIAVFIFFLPGVKDITDFKQLAQDRWPENDFEAVFACIHKLNKLYQDAPEKWISTFQALSEEEKPYFASICLHYMEQEAFKKTA